MDPVTIGIIVGVVGLGVSGVSVGFSALQTHYTRRQLRLAEKGTNQAANDPIPSQIQIISLPPSGLEYDTDFEESNFKSWLEEEVGYIAIRGIGLGKGPGVAAFRFPIEKLYTQLYVQRGLTNWNMGEGRESGAQRIALQDVVARNRCLVIMGDPGSGKTTFLKYIAHQALQSSDDTFPIYLSLADFYQFTVQKKENSDAIHNTELRPEDFLDFLLKVSENENLGLTRFGLKERIDAGKCLWFLDSLDELPSSLSREKLVEMVTSAARRWKNCRFVIASRPLAVTGKAIPSGFEIVSIDQMSDEEIWSFLDTWSSLIFQAHGNRKRSEYCRELYATIMENSQFRILAKNPVMLTSMAVVHYNEKRLPEGRANLLESVIHWLIHAKERTAISRRDLAEFIEARYRELALRMFQDPDGRKIRVGRAWVAKQISHYFAGNEQEALDFLTKEENETGLLVRRGEGDLAFWLLWFQEYLAAKEIAGRTDVEWWSLIKDHLDDPEWSEVLCLVPACLNRMGSARVDLFFEHLSASCENLDLATKAKRVGLGGRILRDLLVVGYSPTLVASWKQTLNAVFPLCCNSTLKLSTRERYEAIAAYGLWGDDRFQDFEATWSSIDGGDFFIGAQASDPLASGFDPFARSWESPVVRIQLPPFDIRKYLVTVQEFKEFVEDGGYLKKVLWSETGWSFRLSSGIESPMDWDEQLLLPNCPVTGVSWYEARAYCEWLTRLHKASGRIYSLPSEAQWEYALRRNILGRHRFSWGDCLQEGDRAEANWDGCRLRKKSPVGMFGDSDTIDGISDMIGNVEEWCEDCWTPNHDGRPLDGKPFLTDMENRHVVRGGSTIRVLRLCRTTYRSRTVSDKRYHTIGFRPVRSIADVATEKITTELNLS